MLERIAAQLAQKSLTERELALRLQMDYDTLLRKLEGKAPFTLDEAIRLKEALGSTDSIETLFFDGGSAKKNGREQ